MTDSGLPNHIENTCTRMKQKAVSVQNSLTDGDFKTAMAAYIAGTVFGLFIFNARGSNAELMLKKLAEMKAAPAYGLAKSLLSAFIFEAVVISATPFILYKVYINRKDIWKFTVLTYHLSIYAFAIPAVAWLHIANNDIMWTPWGIVEGIPAWPGLLYFSVLVIDKIYHKVKQK